MRVTRGGRRIALGLWSPLTRKPASFQQRVKDLAPVSGELFAWATNHQCWVDVQPDSNRARKSRKDAARRRQVNQIALLAIHYSIGPMWYLNDT